ncbi:unnamed protein product [Ceutorhynchus assimilis]|uniref:HECT domain-containing protein n=1 Tax=Ceutorhynchus assimilis TaxID=467358 RepID=A0A9N9N1Q3_9CUCU|nr:unnamed protein product [Ceutorhynchus assimilis]
MQMAVTFFIHSAFNIIIDFAAVKVMTDQKLSTYLPAHGDRLALKSCALKTRRKSLIEKLKTTFNHFGDNNKEKAHSTKKMREKPQKSTRMVEIGWRHYCDKKQCFKHVRGPIGGNRRISILKIAKAEDITETAIQLFFPDGSSPYGKIDEFDFELQDYKCHKITNDIDVNEIYKVTGLTNVRFYLSTKRKTSLKNSIDDDDYVTGIKTPPRLTMTLRRRSLDKLIDDLSSPVNNPSTSISGPSTSTSDQMSETPERVDVRSFYEDFVSMDNQPFSMDPLTFEIGYGDIDNVEAAPIENIMVLRRGHIFEDLLKAFEQNFFDSGSLKIEMILPSGEREIAEDLGGVWRDALSEFWSTFYEKCTVGTIFKVPCIRHDFGDKEWRSVGKILFCGYTSEKYFPIQMAPVFVKYCFFIHFEDDELTSNFLNFISETDKQTIEEAQKNFDSVSHDELIDVFASYDCKWAPTKDNLGQLIRDIAHQELIQKPAFIVKCIQQELGKKVEAFSEILNVYETLKPSVRNCLSKIILYNPENTTLEQSNVFNFLKKFIKETDDKTRESLFRFCTGSNLPIVTIKVDFTQTLGVARLPIGHTCSGLLQISSTYESYVVFRNELKSVLSSNIWVMDIV